MKNNFIKELIQMNEEGYEIKTSFIEELNGMKVIKINDKKKTVGELSLIIFPPKKEYPNFIKINSVNKQRPCDYCTGNMLKTKQGHFKCNRCKREISTYVKVINEGEKK